MLLMKETIKCYKEQNKCKSNEKLAFFILAMCIFMFTHIIYIKFMWLNESLLSLSASQIALQPFQGRSRSFTWTQTEWEDT